MSTENLELKARIEAALYAAGRPLSLDELVRVSGTTSRKKVLESARSLGDDVSRALTALQVLEIDNERFIMQLKSEYSSVAKKFATRALLPKSVMKTLSYIVYFQPIMGQELASRRGGQSYTHLKELRSMGFIKSERIGRSRLYRTSDIFSEYFGLSKDSKTMKQELKKRGLKERQLSPTG